MFKRMILSEQEQLRQICGECLQSRVSKVKSVFSFRTLLTPTVPIKKRDYRLEYYEEYRVCSFRWPL